MLSLKKLSAKELFESIRIEKTKAEQRAEDNRNLILNHLKELKGEKTEDKLTE
jgi:hypothetical protein